MIFVLGSQLALFNILSSFGVPFYHIDIKFGLGFVYDLVADGILISGVVTNTIYFQQTDLCPRMVIPKFPAQTSWLDS